MDQTALRESVKIHQTWRCSNFLVSFIAKGGGYNILKMKNFSIFCYKCALWWYDKSQGMIDCYAVLDSGYALKLFLWGKQVLFIYLFNACLSTKILFISQKSCINSRALRTCLLLHLKQWKVWLASLESSFLPLLLSKMSEKARN